MFKITKFRGLLALALVLVLMVSVTFADEVGVKRPLINRFDQAENQLGQRGELALEKRDQYRSRMTEVVEAYAPDLMGDFESFWTSHDALHSALMTLHQEQIEAMKAKVSESVSRIKEAIKAGEMTREEAKAELEAMRNQFSEARAADRVAIEALKADLDVNPETVKSLHDELKAAVDAGDAEAVESALLDIIEAHQQHLAFDTAKLDYFQAKE